MIADGTGTSTTGDSIANLIAIVSALLATLTAVVAFLTSTVRWRRQEKRAKIAPSPTSDQVPSPTGGPAPSEGSPPMEQLTISVRDSSIGPDGRRVDIVAGPELGTSVMRDLSKLLTRGDEQRRLWDEYHQQGLRQSRQSFLFSLVFAGVGFAVVVSGILRVQQGTAITSQASAFVSLTAGTIVDVVSVLFFTQSNRARRLMAEFFDKLIADRKFSESIRLAQMITNSDLKGKVQALLALSFAGVEDARKSLRLVLGTGLEGATTSGILEKEHAQPHDQLSKGPAEGSREAGAAGA